MTAAAPLLLAALASAVIAGGVRRYAMHHALLDLPNERSSHTRPTPRGGGLAIVLVTLGGIVLLSAAGRVGRDLAAALCGGGTIVAAVGWLDDRRGLRAEVRVAAHIGAASWALVWLGGMPTMSFSATPTQLGLLGTCLGGLGIVWATNLYNFMDGIDGLAAGESTVAGGVGALLLMTTAPSLAWVAAVLAAASGGFLVWNWPPARLFMGDVGSGFIGFVFGVLAVAGERYSSMPALLWLVLLGPFVADATITLLRRMARGERWHAAHRSHAYQRAVQAGRSHRTVTLAMLALTVVSGMAAAIIERRPVLLLPVLLASIALLAGAYVAVERVHPMGGSVEN